MKTKILFANPLLSSSDLQVISELIRSGGLAAIPTETVYGLAADLFCERAVQGIFRVKGRAGDNPLIAHVSDFAQLEGVIVPPSPLFFRLAEKFWPGPLTLVVERHSQVPAIAAAHLSTIAVRMPSFPCARQIIEAVGSPLVAPSANRSGSPSATSARDVLEDFSGEIAAVVDGGDSPFGIESTVVGLFKDRPQLLRPGAISREEIEEVLGEVLQDPEGVVRSPGMKYRHYAPKAKVILLEEGASLAGAYVPDCLSEKNLYAHFRNADRLGYAQIAISLNSNISSNEALMDRIQKAAKG